MRPVGPMKPVIQQKMPNVASSLPDAPDRDLHETRDQRCRWGAKTERERETRKTERAHGKSDRRLRSRGLKKSPRGSPPLPFE